MKIEKVVFQVKADRPPILVGVVLIVGEIVEFHHIGFELSGKIASRFDLHSEIPEGVVHFYPTMERREQLAEIVRETSEKFVIVERFPKYVVA